MKYVNGSTEGSSEVRFIGGGRAYLYTDNRWVISGSWNYPAMHVNNISQNGGTGSDPAPDPRSFGHLVKQGDKVTGLMVQGTCAGIHLTGDNLNDVEYGFWFVSYDPIGRFYDGGLTPFATVRQQVFRDFWLGSQLKPEAAYSGNQTHQPRFLSFDALDFVAPSDGVIVFCARPTGTMAAQRYFYVNYSLELEPQND